MEQIVDEITVRVSAKKKDPHARPAASFEVVLPLRMRQTVPPQRAPHRWGVVLAGGDGVRMRGLTQWVYGDDRPKQFCPLLSDRTLVEEARRRAERSIPMEQILFSVTRPHEAYYRRYLAGRQPQRIVQPSNRGTAPAILSALQHVAQLDPDAIVSILPSDHYYSSESAFSASLDSAFKIAEQRADSLILLAAEPTGPEVEYGWIETGATVDGHSELFRVEGFREKPPLPVAETLLRSGSLWNTFVIVGRVHAFMEMAWATVPRLMQVLESERISSYPGAEIRIPDSLYDQIAPMDFSRQILAFARSNLLAFRLRNTEWNDLGDPNRLLATLLEINGNLPGWAKQWPAVSTRGMAAIAA